jgi:glycine cleavage system H lipoate-binding protein
MEIAENNLTYEWITMNEDPDYKFGMEDKFLASINGNVVIQLTEEEKEIMAKDPIPILMEITKIINEKIQIAEVKNLKFTREKTIVNIEIGDFEQYENPQQI